MIRLYVYDVYFQLKIFTFGKEEYILLSLEQN